MIGWIEDRFGIYLSWATFGYPTHIAFAGLHYTAWPDDYYEVEFCLLGLCIAFGYWPNGKYDESEGAGV